MLGSAKRSRLLDSHQYLAKAKIECKPRCPCHVFSDDADASEGGRIQAHEANDHQAALTHADGGTRRSARLCGMLFLPTAPQPSGIKQATLGLRKLRQALLLTRECRLPYYCPRERVNPPINKADSTKFC